MILTKGHFEQHSGWSTEAICYLNYLHLSCQNKIFNILIYKILETTYPIELKFTGIREGSITSGFKVSEQSNKFEEKCQNMEFWEISTIGMSYGPVRTRFNQ